MTLDRQEFHLLMSNPEVIHHVTAFGSDVGSITGTAELIFQKETGSSREGEISFEELFCVLARLGIAQNATLPELMGVREYSRQRFDEIKESVEQILARTADPPGSTVEPVDSFQL